MERDPDGWSFLLSKGSLHHKDRRVVKINIPTPVTTADRLGILLNSPPGTLTLFVNGVSAGVVFDNIPTDQDLCGAVGFWDEGDEISIEHQSVGTHFHIYPSPTKD